MKATTLAILTLACAGSPTAPEGVAIGTAYGIVNLWTDGSPCDARCAGKVVDALERGQRRALAQRPDAPSLNGLTVAVYRQQVWHGVDSVGAYNENEDVLLGLSGVEEVYEHELQHRAAWKLGHHGDCYYRQDHSPGYDLLCQPR